MSQIPGFLWHGSIERKNPKNNPLKLKKNTGVAKSIFDSKPIFKIVKTQKQTEKIPHNVLKYKNSYNNQSNYMLRRMSQIPGYLCYIVPF